MSQTATIQPETAHLFDSLRIRDVEFRNRIGVAPMCMYSAVDGVPNDWHFVHLGSRAVGGASVVIAEATAVLPNGRISWADAGIWNDEQVAAWKRITSFIKEHGAVPGIQLAHAGRKAGTDVPWKGGAYLPDLGWDIVGPSPVAFSDRMATPREMTHVDIEETIEAFGRAAERALEAGFEVVEIHAAHGYLNHEFLSPISNQRKDEYGGSLENRVRFTVEVARRIRKSWPERLPVFARISASDWVEGGWDGDQSVYLSKRLKEEGVDLIHVSTGGNVAVAEIPVGPGYQVPFAAQIRREAGILTGAVGLIEDPRQAEQILESGEADFVFLAREMLRDPYWPRRAAVELGAEIKAPGQYLRGWDQPR